MNKEFIEYTISYIERSSIEELTIMEFLFKNKFAFKQHFPEFTEYDRKTLLAYVRIELVNRGVL